MSAHTIDIVAIGNAIVDVIAPADDAFLATHALSKGAMQLIDAETADLLYVNMGAGLEISGGSAANTLVGMAALGAQCAFVGQVRDDQLGEVFAHDIRALGIDFSTALRDQGPPTARCLIVVTPDAQRTMNTFLGASQHLGPDAIDTDMISRAGILYLEGYLWDPELPRAAMRKAIEVARAAGRTVAFSLSDALVVDRHRADIRAMIENGEIDVMFANEVEIQSLAEANDFERAVKSVAGQIPILVVTRGEKGAIAIADGERYEVEAVSVAKVVDTTGAGDLFAAGFLNGQVRGLDIGACLNMGATAAAEIISHFGARPQADLKALMAR